MNKLLTIAELLDMKMPDCEFKNVFSLAKSKTHVGNDLVANVSYLHTGENSEFHDFNVIIDQQNQRIYSPPNIYFIDPLKITSNVELRAKMNMLGDVIFSRTIFMDSSLFMSAPDCPDKVESWAKQKSIGKNENGKIEEIQENENESKLKAKVNGDQYWLTQKLHFIAEFRTELSLPTKADDTPDRLVALYNNGIDSCVDKNRTMSKRRAIKLLNQVFWYTKLATTNCSKVMYVLLSNYVTTFLIKVQENDLFISRPFPIEYYLRLKYFVLVTREPNLACDPRLREIVAKANATKEMRIPLQPASTHQMTSRSENKLTEKNIFRAWNESGVYIGEGYSGFASKIKYQEKHIVLKMCDIYKHSYGALGQLENEAKVLIWLNKTIQKNKFVPEFHFIETLAIFRTIAMEFISGTCYEEFSEMNTDAKYACLDSLSKLHKLKVLHGDIRAPNFILAESKDPKQTLAYIIDFGLARLDANQEDLLEEKRLLVEELEFNWDNVKHLLE